LIFSSKTISPFGLGSQRNERKKSKKIRLLFCSFIILLDPNPKGEMDVPGAKKQSSDTHEKDSQIIYIQCRLK
jgi:hypothetical protein